MSLPQQGDVIADKYRIECTLGRGGTSVVFGAVHTVTGKRFALKWLITERAAASTDLSRRFMREARLAERFAHPNVVQVYDFGEVSGSFYMVMEWLDGESLAARLERSGQLDFVTARALLLPCMGAIDKAHEAGIVHRDLKPANIFLCHATEHRAERVKVLDFGISKWATAPGELNSLVTQTGTLIGTPHYVSPEQLRGRAIDGRTDVYAFGVILYELLSGKLPFPADNFGDLAIQIAAGTPVPLSSLLTELTPGVEAVVARAMARSADERFQTVNEMMSALEEIPPIMGAYAVRVSDAPSSIPARPARSVPVTPPSTPPDTPAPVPYARVQTPAPDSSPGSLQRSAARPSVRASYVVGVLVLGIGAFLLVRAVGRTHAPETSSDTSNAQVTNTQHEDSARPDAAAATPLPLQAHDAGNAATHEADAGAQQVTTDQQIGESRDVARAGALARPAPKSTVPRTPARNSADIRRQQDANAEHSAQREHTHDDKVTEPASPATVVQDSQPTRALPSEEKKDRNPLHMQLR